MATEEILDYEDGSLLGDSIIIWTMEPLFSSSLLLGLELGVFLAIMRLEYLMSHIGEKRFVSQALNVNNSSLFARFSMTVLFYRTVFSIFSAPFVDVANRPTTAFRSVLICPISSKVNFYSWRFFSDA